MNWIHKFILEKDIKVKSITVDVDNGLEFQAMGIAAKRLGVKLYKCDPYCSFQRGSNEDANGIVRRYIYIYTKRKITLPSRTTILGRY